MIIITGNAGSGKTTQGKRLAAKLGCPFFSMGEFLRKYGNQDIQAKMDAGELLSNADTLPFLETFFAGFVGAKTELVTDGFPRSIDQAEWIVSEIEAGKLNFTALIHLNLSEAEAKQRMLARGREDDSESSITTRFREQEPMLIKVLNLFKGHNMKVIEIDGSGSEDEVAARIGEAIGAA